MSAYVYMQTIFGKPRCLGRMYHGVHTSVFLVKTVGLKKGEATHPNRLLTGS